jgi:hypothetical protein
MVSAICHLEGDCDGSLSSESLKVTGEDQALNSRPLGIRIDRGRTMQSELAAATLLLSRR